MNELKSVMVKTASGKSHTYINELSISDSLYTALKGQQGVYVVIDIDSNKAEKDGFLKPSFRTVKLASKKQECGYVEFKVDFETTKQVNNAIVNSNTKSVKIFLCV